MISRFDIIHRLGDLKMIVHYGYRDVIDEAIEYAKAGDMDKVLLILNYVRKYINDVTLGKEIISQIIHAIMHYEEDRQSYQVWGGKRRRSSRRRRRK